MELTEDVIAEIKRTATEALNSGISNRVTGMTILLLVEELELQRDISNALRREVMALRRGEERTARTTAAELERLQAENAALREAMEEYRAALLPFADCYQNEVPESDKALFKNRVLIDVTVEDLLRAAMVKYDLKMGLPDSLLDAKPDAAPVETPAPAREIAVGDRVRITGGLWAGYAGTVTGFPHEGYCTVGVYKDEDKVLGIPLEQVERI